MNGLNKLSIKHRLTFNHKLANSMSEKAKQGRFMKSYWFTTNQSLPDEKIHQTSK